MSYQRGALQNEIQRGLVANFDLRRGAGRVVKQNGVITGSVPFDPQKGAVFPGTGSDYIGYNTPTYLLDVQDSSNYLTFLCEFFPTYAYDYDARQAPFATSDSGSIISAHKLQNSGSNALRIYIGGNSFDISSATYSSYWTTGERNQLVISTVDGDTDVWLNGQSLVSGNATAFVNPIQQSVLYVGDNWNFLTPFFGSVSMVKIFKGDKFTTQDVQAYWNQRITARPEQAASYWFFDQARHDATNVQSLDVARNARHMQFGDGATSTTYPTKLSKHGYSFDGGDYLIGSTEPAIVASDSITLECEFTLDDVAGFHGLLSRSTGATNTSCFLRIDDGKVEFYFTNTSNVNRQWEETGTSIQFGQRYHIVFQHTFGTATSTRCFLNGRELAGAWVAGGGDQPEENAAWTWQIGDREAGAQPITGDIYHAGVWEEYLSSLECIDLYIQALNRRNKV